MTKFVFLAVLHMFKSFFPWHVHSEEMCRRLKFDDPVYGYALQGHVIVNLTIGKGEFCRHRCTMESNCLSFNLGPQTNEKWVCELSNSDHMRHPGDMKTRQGFFYRGTENSCNSNPCSKNGACFNGYTEKKYLCVCEAGYTGENCERDVNECSQGSHACDVSATCINTDGSFACACKDGYFGDGRFCSGFPFLWVLNGTDRLITLFNGASFQTVDSRKVLYLDGNGAYAETPAIPIQTTSFSILCWVKALSYPASDSVDIYSDWSLPYQFRLAIVFGKLSVTLRRPPGSSTIVDPFGGYFPIGTWTHVSFTWSRENRTGKLYMNGTETGKEVADQSKSVDLNPTGHRVFDIGLKRDTGETLNGYLRDLMVFHRAISDAELTDVFAWSNK